MEESTSGQEGLRRKTQCPSSLSAGKNSDSLVIASNPTTGSGDMADSDKSASFKFKGNRSSTTCPSCNGQKCHSRMDEYRNSNNKHSSNYDSANKEKKHKSDPRKKEQNSSKTNEQIEYAVHAEEKGKKRKAIQEHEKQNESETERIKYGYRKIRKEETENMIITFKKSYFLTPRGAYDVKIFSTYIQLEGKRFCHTISFNSISDYIFLEHGDGRKMYFVLSISPPLVEGVSFYNLLVLFLRKDDDIKVELSLSEKETQLKDVIMPFIECCPPFEVLIRTLSKITQKKIVIQGPFKGYNDRKCIPCLYRGEKGLLYPLERSFLFINGTCPVHIELIEIYNVAFTRCSCHRNGINLEVETKYRFIHAFKNIKKEDYRALVEFIYMKRILIKLNR